MMWIIQNRVQIGVAVILVLLYIFAYTKGYNAADKKWLHENTLAENKALKEEVARRKRVETMLTKEKEKNEELDKAYAKAIKEDINYKCVIPDSLVHYINSI